jgi:hypothetical protein
MLSSTSIALRNLDFSENVESPAAAVRSAAFSRGRTPRIYAPATGPKPEVQLNEMTSPKLQFNTEAASFSTDFHE